MFGVFWFGMSYFAEGPGAFPTPPTPGAGGENEKITLGTKESLSVTSQPTVGGRWSW